MAMMFALSRSRYVVNRVHDLSPFKGKLINPLTIVLLIAGLMVSGLTGYAHHSFAATYEEDSMIEIEGQVVQFLFRNPHSSLQVQALDDNGEIVRYGVEWGGAGQLGGQGVTRASLSPGDHVVIVGNPGRNPADHKIRMRSLFRPSDGYSWGRDGQDFD